MSESNWEILFEKLSMRNRKILAQQSETTFAQALAQVERLKKNSKVEPFLKKCRKDFMRS